MTRLVVPALVALVLALPGRGRAEDVTVTRVKYEGLARFIQAQKGKVVVVDFWATWCVPCKKNFPHLVALHRKFAATGLVAVSVSLDDPKDSRAAETVRQFLLAQKATFPNFLLDEPFETWRVKLGSETIPLVFVFNRTGQIEEKYREAPKPAALEKLVEQLLRQK